MRYFNPIFPFKVVRKFNKQLLLDADYSMDSIMDVLESRFDEIDLNVLEKYCSNSYKVEGIAAICGCDVDCVNETIESANQLFNDPEIIKSMQVIKKSEVDDLLKKIEKLEKENKKLKEKLAAATNDKPKKRAVTRK